MPDHYKPFKMKGFSGFGEGTGSSPMKGYKSDAQRKAVHASKADGGKGNPNKMHKTMYNDPAKMHKSMYNSPAKAAKPDYIDLDGDGNKTESMKKAAMDKKKAAPTKMYGKKAPNKMGHTYGPKGAGPKTERQANMSKQKALNKRGSELGAKDPMRKKMFDAADKLGDERYERAKAGKPMKMYGKKAAPKMKHGDKPMKMKHADKPMKMGHKSKPAKMGHKSAPTKNYKKGYYGA